MADTEKSCAACVELASRGQYDEDDNTPRCTTALFVKRNRRGATKSAYSAYSLLSCRERWTRHAQPAARSNPKPKGTWPTSQKPPVYFHSRVVVDDRLAVRFVEASCKVGLGGSYAHSVGDSLPKRACVGYGKRCLSLNCRAGQNEFEVGRVLCAKVAYVDFLGSAKAL